MEFGNGWYCLTTGDIPKIINCAEFMRIQFTIDSDLGGMSVWIYRVPGTKYKLKYSLDLDCFEAKHNVDDVLN